MVAVLLGATFAGAAGASLNQSKSSLRSQTNGDVAKLIAREKAVVADLNAYRRLGRSASVGALAAKLKADEMAQELDAVAVNVDLSGSPPIPAGPTTGAVLLTQSGSGEASTLAFTVPEAAKGWHVNWTYNCTSFGGSGDFDYAVDSGAILNFKDSGPDQFAASGSGTQHYHDAGIFSLSVDSECDWAIQVISGS